MPPRSKAAIEAAREKAARQKERIVWIGIAATEANMERLSAFLIFADRVQLEAPIKLGPLPWEDPNDPRYIEGPPELQIDYEVVKRSITKLLGQYVERHGATLARSVLESFGAPRLSEVEQSQLIPLHNALEAALQENA